jgi:branched-chain amino acid transport system permease protein
MDAVTPMDTKVSSAAKAGSVGSAKVAMAIFIVLLSLVFPLLFAEYNIFQATMTLSIAIALFGMNFLVGYSGQISLGHGAIYAIGAYVSAILMNQFGWNYAATIPVAAISCFVFGFLFGIPALRLNGHYLALVTFVLAAVMPQLLKHAGLSDYTGGSQGLSLNKPPVPFNLPISQDQWLYYFTLSITILMFVLGWNLVRGRIGQLMIATRDQPIAATAMGVNVAYYKSMTFGVSALYTGVAGALSAIIVQYVSPESFNVFLSISLLVGVVVGGLGTIAGAFYGAIFVQFVPNIAGDISQSAPWAIYGAILIGVVYLAPDGVAGLVSSLAKRVRRGL